MKKIGIALALLAVFGLIGMVGATVPQGALTAYATIESAPAPICQLGLSGTTVKFPTPLYGGETLAPDVSTGITVTNQSTTVSYTGGTPSVVGVSTGVTVSGDYWYGYNYGTPGDWMPVEQTSVLLGASGYIGTPVYASQFALTASPSGDIIDLAPTASGGTAQILFGLSVPSGQTADNYYQTITVATTC